MNSFFGLPEEVKFCKKCVISNQRPSSTVEFKSTAIDKKDEFYLIKMGFVQHVILQKLKMTLIGQKEKIDF